MFYLILPSFTEFTEFTGFYRVLPSFTEFYLDLPSSKTVASLDHRCVPCFTLFSGGEKQNGRIEQEKRALDATMANKKEKEEENSRPGWDAVHEKPTRPREPFRRVSLALAPHSKKGGRRSFLIKDAAAVGVLAAGSGKHQVTPPSQSEIQKKKKKKIQVPTWLGVGHVTRLWQRNPLKTP